MFVAVLSLSCYTKLVLLKNNAGFCVMWSDCLSATHFLKYLINWKVNRNFQYRTVLTFRVSAQSTNFGRKSPPPKVFSKSAISINIHSSLMGGLTPGSAPVLSPSNSPGTSPTKPSSPPLQENLPPVSANKVCIIHLLVGFISIKNVTILIFLCSRTLF